MEKYSIQSGAFEHVQQVFEAGANEATRKRYLGDNCSLLIGRPIVEAPGFDLTEPLLVENIHFLSVREGSMDVHINLMQHHLGTGSMIILGPGTIYQIDGYAEDTLCDILVIRQGWLSHLPSEWKPEFLSEVFSIVVESMSGEEHTLFQTLSGTLMAIAPVKDPGMESSILSAFIQFAARFRQRAEQLHSASRQQEIFNTFLRLVSRFCREQHHLAFYADKMALTQNHLSRIVSEHSGVTAKEWIERALLMEAKVLLRHTDKSIHDISETLNFPADSFFCRYFKRLTGQTPRQYRIS